jgi:hypothetical protein
MRKAIAVLAAAGTLGISAFATTAAHAAETGGPDPSGNWSNTFTISSSITLTLKTSSTTITPNLGGTAYTNAPGDFTSPAQTVTVGSNDSAGYSLTEQETQGFKNGANVIADTATAGWNPATKSYLPFDASGNAPDPLSSPSTVSGGMGANPSDGGGYSDSGNDVYPVGTAVTLPANLPAGDYTASFTFAALGN